MSDRVRPGAARLAVRRARGAVAALVMAVAAVWAAPAAAVPRFALRQGTTCATCHVNPSGGAMRTSYGRDVFAPTRLVWSRADTPAAPDLGSGVSLGGDARVAHLSTLSPRPAADGSRMTGTFFPMQVDLDLAVERGPLTLLVDWGLLGSWEAMVMARHGPLRLRAGRFMVPYGLRLDNHTAYVREAMGFGPRDKDVGLEAALTVPFSVGVVHLQTTASNGAGGEALLDDNHDKAGAARLELVLRLPGRLGPARPVLMAGASAYRNVTGHVAVTEGRTVHDRLGLFGGAALGRLTLLGEGDLAIDDDLGAPPLEKGRTRKLAGYGELGLLVRRGLEAQVTYEYLDPDIDLRPNARHRLGAQLDLFPAPMLAVHVLARWVTSPPGSPDRHTADAMIQVHVYY